MADGKIIIKIDAEVAKAQKEMDSLSKKLEKQQTELDKLSKKYNEVSEAAERAATSYGTRKEIKAELQRERSLVDKYKHQAAVDKAVIQELTLTGQKQGFETLREFQSKPGVNKGLTTIQANKLGINMSEYERYLKMLDKAEVRLADNERIYKLHESRVSDLSQALEKANAAVKELGQSAEQLELSEKMQTARDTIDELSKQYDYLITKITELQTQKAERQNYLQGLADSAREVNPEIAKLYDRLNELKQRLADMKEAGLGPGFTEYDQTVSEIQSINSELKGTEQESSNNVAIVNKLNAAFNRVWAVVKKIGKATVSAFGKILKSSIKGLLSPLKSLNKSITSFGKRLKTAVLQGLVFRQVRTAMYNLMSTIGELLKANSALAVSLGQLKGTALTAFQPVLNAIIPALIKLISWIQIAIAYIAKLLSLFGLFAKANSKTAKSLANVGGAAGGAGGAIDKFLASFDTIEKISQSGGGGGGGGGDISPTFDFDWEDIDFSERLKDAILRGDWYGIGMEVGKKLDEIIEAINDWISNKFSPWIEKAGKDLGDFINGLVDSSLAAPDEAKLGYAIANFMNSIFNALYNFATTVNWDSIGQKIADEISTFFEKFDAKKAGMALKEFVLGILTAIDEAIRDTDWTLVGQSIADMLENLGWKDILHGVAQLIADALLAVKDIIEGATDWNLDWLLPDNIDADSLLQTITDITAALLGMKVAISLLTSSNSNLQALGGIVLFVVGAFASIKGFLAAWKDGLNAINVGAIALGVTLMAIAAILLGAPKLVTIVIATIVFIVAMLVLKIKEHWEEIKQSFTDAWDNIKQTWEEAPEWFNENVIQPIIDFFSPITDRISSIFDGCWTLVKAIWKIASDWFNNNVVQPIITAFSPVTTKVKDFFSQLWEDVKQIWNNAPSWFSENVIDPLTIDFKTAWNTIKNSFSIALEGIVGIAKNKFNNLISLIESAINLIVRGINGLISGFNSVVSWGANVLGTDWTGVSQINGVTLPRLAQGAVVNPGHEFTAILGDNRREKEIVSPLSTMKQAFMEALAESNISNNQPIIMQIDGKTFARVANPYFKNETNRIGVKVVGV